MTPEVKQAIREIAEAYPTSSLETADDGQGGAIVTIKDLGIEGPYAQSTTWFGFHITHTYPYSDVYPHFVRHDLSRRDQKPLGEATSIGSFSEPAGNPTFASRQAAQRRDRHGASQTTKGDQVVELSSLKAPLAPGRAAERLF